MILYELIQKLKDRIGDAERDAAESSKLAMNSYGSGYDRGFADALKEVLSDVSGVNQ